MSNYKHTKHPFDENYYTFICVVDVEATMVAASAKIRKPSVHTWRDVCTTHNGDAVYVHRLCHAVQ